MSDNELTLSTLDHNGLWRGNAADNKDVRAEVSVFRGSLSLGVFDKSKGGPPVWKLTITRDVAALTKRTFAYLLTQPPGTKCAMTIEEWDQQTRKSNPVATLIYGINTKNNPYIGVTCPAGSYQFPLRMGLKVNVSQSGIPEEIVRAAAIDAFVNALDFDGVMSQRLSAVKRQMGAGGGGKGNWNNNRGGQGGGGGYTPRQAPAQTDNDSEFPY